MKKGKKRSLTPVIVILIVLLLAVVGVIIWRQYEYGASDAYYDSLRGMARRLLG